MRIGEWKRKRQQMTTKLDQIEALSKAATPGPWSTFNRIGNPDLAGPDQVSLLGCCEYDMSMISKEDGALIATMRNNIDALLEVARAAQKLRCRENNKYHCHEVGFTELEEALDKLK
jgi:hypothetical protein